MSNANNSKLEDLKDRLYAELKATSTESEEFKAAFRYLRELESDKEEDLEIKELEKEHLKIKIEKERSEIKNLETEKKAWFGMTPDAIVPALLGFAGVVVIVSAETFGTAILNSKAMTRLPKP